MTVLAIPAKPALWVPKFEPWRLLKPLRLDQFVPGFPRQFGDTLGRVVHPATQQGGVTYGDSVSADLGNSTAVSTAATIGPIDGGQTNWVQYSGSPNFSATNLVDQTNSATTLDLSSSSSFTANVSTRATDDGGDEFDMFTRGGRIQVVSGFTTDMAITQIPYTNYDVVVCFDEVAGNTSGVGVSFTDGTTTYYFQTAAAAQWSGSWVQVTSENSGSPDTAGNYVVFSNLSGASLTISVGPDSNFASIALTGMQIIERV